MKIKTVKISPTVRNVLLASKIDGQRLTLQSQLDRGVYEEVAKAILAAGGRWSRKEQCHVFPNDVRQVMDITGDSVEVVNRQQTFQSFYTPVKIARQVMELADLFAGQKVLEPSAGSGRLLDELLLNGIFKSDIVAVEFDGTVAETLKQKGFNVLCADFLACGDLDWPEKFDRIVMNPPFTNGQDIKHIRHAMKFLGEDGRIVAICANGPKQHEEFDAVASQWIDLEPGAFSESGTNVNAAIVIFQL